MPLYSTPFFKSFLEKWQKIQDFLSFICGFSISLYDFQGKLLSSSGGENALCQTLKNYPRTRKRCLICAEENIALTFQKCEPMVSKCYANLYYFLIPINLNQTEKILLLGGKVYFSREDFLEFIRVQDLKLPTTDLNILSKTTPIKSSRDFEIFFSYFKNIVPTFLRDIYLKEVFSRQSFRLETFMNFIVDFAHRLSPEEIYLLLSQTVNSLFNVNTTAVIFLDERKNLIKTRVAFGQWEEAIRMANLKKGKLIEKVLSEEKPLFSNEVDEIHDTGWIEEISSVYIFPLHKTEEEILLLCIFNSELPSSDEIKLLSLFCNQFSSVLKNVKSRELFYKKLSYLVSLSEIDQFLSSSLELETFCKVILEKITELLGSEKASLMIYNETTGELLIKAGKGIDEEILKHLKIKAGEGIAGMVFKEGKPLLVRDITRELKKERSSGYKSNSFISVPLKSGTKTLGVLNFADKISKEPFNEEDLELLLSLVPYIAVAIEKIRFYLDSEHYRQLSIVDHLTGLADRRYFEDRLSQEIKRAKRYNHSLSLLLADIDDFKIINDSKGHLTGDEVLKMIGQLFKSNLRDVDIVARYGGEEFTVILPETSKEKAVEVAERIRRTIENFSPLQAFGIPFTRITLSFGVASYPDDAENLRALIANVDKALYLAKSEGKNKVVFYKG